MRRTLIVGALTCLLAPVGMAEERAKLADAVEQQRQKAIVSLLKDRAQVNLAQPDGMTALHWAAHHDDLATAKALVKAGAKTAAANRYGVTSLSLACQNGSQGIVELLLKAGADANTTLPGGESVLMTAARTGRPGPVRALLAAGAKVNAKERKGQSAIMWAAAEGNVEVVDILIKAKADFTTALPSGFTPYFFAIREGRTRVVQRLLAAGIDVNSVMQPERRSGKMPQRGTSGLLLAVENGHFELAEILLKAGANAQDDRLGYTALHAMSWVRKPLRGDGDPPPIGSGKMTSLELVRSLVRHGAKVDARHKKRPARGGRLNKTKATPLLLAAETGDLPLMKLLLELGANPRLPNADDCTPLLAAAGVGILSNGDESAGTEAEAIAAIKLLVDLGLDVNAVDSNGESAVHGAAYKSWSHLIRFLADNGADIKVWNRKNKRGWTPLMIAQGHRPGNFRPSVKTIAAVSQVMRAAGVEPPVAKRKLSPERER